MYLNFIIFSLNPHPNALKISTNLVGLIWKKTFNMFAPPTFNIQFQDLNTYTVEIQFLSAVIEVEKRYFTKICSQYFFKKFCMNILRYIFFFKFLYVLLYCFCSSFFLFFLVNWRFVFVKFIYLINITWILLLILKMLKSMKHRSFRK